MNPNAVVENEVENDEQESGILVKSLKKSIEDPFSGKKIVAEGEYSLPLASSLEDAEKLVAGNVEDLLFWFNFGRKTAARAQVAAMLSGFDSGDEKINDLYKSFTSAMNSILGEKATPEKRELTKQFILSQDQFSPLKSALENWKPGSVSVDFSQVELKKPSGKKGRPAAEAAAG